MSEDRVKYKLEKISYEVWPTPADRELIETFFVACKINGIQPAVLINAMLELTGLLDKGKGYGKYMRFWKKSLQWEKASWRQNMDGYWNNTFSRVKALIGG